MNRHFIDYSALPTEPLGTPIRREEPKPSPETPWKPCSGHPDYRERITREGIREVTHKDHVPAPVLPVAMTEAAPEKAAAVIAAPAPAADVPEGATHLQLRTFDGSPLQSHHAGRYFYRKGRGRFADFFVAGESQKWYSSCWDNSALDSKHFQPLTQPTASTEWQSGPPPSVGWFSAQDSYDRRLALVSFVRFWNGSAWSISTAESLEADVKAGVARTPASQNSGGGIDFDIRWRGPRLVGADWPEP